MGAVIAFGEGGPADRHRYAYNLRMGPIAFSIGHDIAVARPGSAIEQRELAAEALQHHLGRIAVLAGGAGK
jgi:hypothetical protein